MDERYEDRLERQEMNAQRLREENAARHALPCPECGSADGMQYYSRGGVLFVYQRWPPALIPRTWYYLPGDDHCVYAPCRTCNRAGAVEDAYQPVNDLDAWLESECQCEECIRERSAQ